MASRESSAASYESLSVAPWLRENQTRSNTALDAEPPIASFLKSMLVGGGPVNAVE